MTRTPAAPLGPVPAETFFELDTETLFLIDDDQPEIAEFDPAGTEPVGPYDDVHAAPFQIGDGVFLI